MFEALGCRFDDDVAPCCYGDGHVPSILKVQGDGLTTTWHRFVWCNPPFGGRNGIEPWLERFFAHGNGVLLAPDRTSAPWFWSAWRRADAVLFTRKIRFLRPDGSEGVSPSNGTALFAVGVRGVRALRAAERARFGILARPEAASRDCRAPEPYQSRYLSIEAAGVPVVKDAPAASQEAGL